MRQFGLIGFPLSHSFSKGYFANRFLTENILDAQYENYPIESIDLFLDLWKNNPALKGLNVTIPYKKLVIPFLQHTSSVVESIQACNCERHLIAGDEKAIERIIQLNVNNSIAEILDQSEYLKNKATSGEIKIVSGIYDTQTGAVLFN